MIAERIRRCIEDTVFDIKDHLKIKITVSIGVASYPEHTHDKDELVTRSDQAMYCSKKSNRNAVSLA